MIKPKNFIYLYYEGNDLEGLNWEKKDNHLISYIDDEYNINYLEKYDQIEYFYIKSFSIFLIFLEKYYQDQDFINSIYFYLI